MKKVIITGGAGFIGSNLVKKLLELNVEKLLIIDDLSTGNESNISLIVSDERVQFLNSKIEDIESINELFKDYDFCYHLAAGVGCLLYTSPSPRDRTRSRMPSSA